MDSNLKISIITVVYSGVECLEETILSVTNQTYGNIEYIIIDGGSTDGTVDIIKKYGDKIDYWVSEEDKGIYDAMNKGIELATGDWINFMNAGDSFFNTDVVKRVAPCLSDDSLVIYGKTVIDYGTYTSLRVDLDLSNMYYGQVLGHQSSFINAVYQKKNLFSLEYKIAGDYDFFLKTCIKHKNKFKRLSLIVSVFAANGVSENNAVGSALERMQILKKVKQYKLKIRFYYYLTLLKIIIKKMLPPTIVKKLNTRNRGATEASNVIKNQSKLK